MNQLEIKYFNNKQVRTLSDPRLISNGGNSYKYELVDNTLNDFYEFYVDGKPLLSLIIGPSKYLGFLQDFNGVLGTMAKVYDEFLILSLLGQELTETVIKGTVAKHGKSFEHSHIQLILSEYNNMYPLLYGCAVCADRCCGGVTVKISKELGCYVWTFRNELVLRFGFDIYESVLGGYLKNWKRA